MKSFDWLSTVIKACSSFEIAPESYIMNNIFKLKGRTSEMNGSFDLLILNNAEAAPTVDWLMVIAGIVLLGISLFMFFKLRK